MGKEQLTAVASKEIEAFIKSDHILRDPNSLATYSKDWTKNYDTKASLVLFPTSTEDVVKIVKWARSHKISLVPSGGRTGLSGGACALNGEVIVSFEKMNRILDYEESTKTVRLEPGVITATLQSFANSKNAYYPVDFASRGSSQIGGNIATNAGGIKVLRYGLTRDWVSSLKVVTGAGELLELNRELIKNATGYDLRHLWIGSEGTLGFIVEASMQLTAPPKPLSVLILGFQELDAVLKVFREFHEHLPLTAFEFFSDIALDIVTRHTQLSRPLSGTHPYYLLIEVENIDSTTSQKILDTFESCLNHDWVQDGTIAQSEAQAKDFWRLREDLSEATSLYSPYKNDISVAVPKVSEFLDKIHKILQTGYSHLTVVWYGHIGDGNLHINILKPEKMLREEFLATCQNVNQKLFSIIAELGGAISAEHGVGIVKRSDLHFSRSEAEIKLMKKIKEAFDPDGIMNPGKLF